MNSSREADDGPGTLADDVSAGIESLTTAGEAADELPPPPRRFAGLRSSAVTQVLPQLAPRLSLRLEVGACVHPAASVPARPIR